MTIAFAAALGHAPGWVAWTERATDEQRQALATGVDRLKVALEAARVDSLVLLTSEHWTNFFLDQMSAFCVGRGDSFHGPVEPWMKMPKTAIPGDPELADAIVRAAYAADIEPAFAYELQFDHGTMVPLGFLTPALNLPVVPVFFNTLAAPQPSPRRCYALGQVIGDVARASNKRIGIIATGGMSHDPGERNHGRIDSDFDRRFLDQMVRGDQEALATYTIAELAQAGAGTIELIAWIALAGALPKFSGEVLAYEAVTGWATGMGVMRLDVAA
jgi:aromatic ring-opening dioxygenase catalytic subunit (LigB family)